MTCGYANLLMFGRLKRRFHIVKSGFHFNRGGLDSISLKKNF